MRLQTLLRNIGVASGSCFLALSVSAQASITSLNRTNHSGPNDPGVRSGTGDSGGMLPGLPTGQNNAFVIAQAVFIEVDSVGGTLAGEGDSGLGPSFNMNSCVGCHAFPAAGGSSPFTNPQIKVATLHGAKNVVPSFLSLNGPVREVRFKRNSDGSPDGGVHALFTITGRSDAPAGFALPQTDFATQASNNNVSFRIPTPLFGAGLIEAIPDEAILANKQVNLDQKGQFNISGHENRSGNDGTITRFGWKAQNKSLLMFAGEAYNVEQGVTNDLFPQARETGGNSTSLGHPESTLDLNSGGLGDIEQFTIFMRLLAAPNQNTPDGVSNSSVRRGQSRFNEVGCALCHTASFNTGTSSIAALSNKNVPLFSDLLVHNMGPGLADDISQGNAQGDEFRTAPLWGVGQRIFFLHDGRSRDLDDTIQAHSSNGNSKYRDSEANKSVWAYNNLATSDQQDLLNFLRSL